jgi:hypothetical protein
MTTSHQHPIRNIVHPTHQRVLIKQSRLLELPKLKYVDVESLPARMAGESAHSRALAFHASSAQVRRDRFAPSGSSSRSLAARIRTIDVHHLLVRQL